MDECGSVGKRGRVGSFVGWLNYKIFDLDWILKVFNDLFGKVVWWNGGKKVSWWWNIIGFVKLVG